MASALVQKGLIPQAVECYNAALQINPNLVTLHRYSLCKTVTAMHDSTLFSSSIASTVCLRLSHSLQNASAFFSRNCTLHQKLHPASGTAPCPTQTALVLITSTWPRGDFVLHFCPFCCADHALHSLYLLPGKEPVCLINDAYLVPSHLNPGGTPVCLMNDA